MFITAKVPKFDVVIPLHPYPGTLAQIVVSRIHGLGFVEPEHLRTRHKANETQTNILK